jgi:hypothetical protein
VFIYSPIPKAADALLRKGTGSGQRSGAYFNAVRLPDVRFGYRSSASANFTVARLQRQD